MEKSVGETDSSPDVTQESPGGPAVGSVASGTGPTSPKAFGRYAVRRSLGAGGFGEVYLGHDTLLDRPVAIKLLRPGATPLHGDGETALREARTLAHLRHPGIVTIHDVGVQAGLAITERDDDRFQEAELHRLLGELHLAERDNQGAAEECFTTAIAIARRQQGKAWELRATTSLARLWQRQGRRDEAHAALAKVYGSYTEGFTTPDLVDARALLESLTEAGERE